MKSSLTYAMLLASAIASLNSCGGGGGGGSSAPSAGSQPSAPQPITLVTGGVVGAPTFAEGDTASGAQGGAPSGDGIPCFRTTGTLGLHHHAHLSLYLNGKLSAIPVAVGMYQPAPVTSGYTTGGTCNYDLHTHDATGIIHVEAQSAGAYTLGEFFRIWGKPLSATNVAGTAGSVQAYTAQDNGSGTTGAFTAFAGDPNSIPLLEREEIVIEVGPPFVQPSMLPSVTFQAGY